MTATTEQDRSGGMPVPILVMIAFFLVVGTVGIFFYERARGRAPEVPVLTPEAAAYLPHLQLSEVDMKGAANYLNQTVTTITGKITNNGPRTVRLVEVHFVFRDPYRQILSRERVAIVGRKTGAVATGQTRPFELTFDNTPPGWNQIMPDLVISQLQFE